MKTVCVFRHGQPVEEFKGRCRGGKSDCLLSEEGMEQTRQNVAYLLQRFGRRISDALAVTSDLQRASAFGGLLAEHGCRHVKDPDFNTMYAGQWEGMSWQEIQRRWPEQFAHVTTNGHLLKIPDGEDVRVFQERVLRGWKKWVEESRYDIVVLIAHNCTNGIIHAHATGGPLNLRSQTIGAMDEYRQDDQGIFSLVEKNAVRYTSTIQPQR